MNLVVDFVFNEFDNNLRMALNKVLEIEVSDDSETTTTGGEEDFSLQNKPTTDFSISNGGDYLINHHIEQSNHKRLAETQAKEHSRSIHDCIPASSTLTKLTAAELSLVYHGVSHGYSYLSQSCTVDLLKKIFNDSQIGQNITCGKTKARELSRNTPALGFWSGS
ncbi:unnamed protein product [Rotaria sp. Silwood1]|nr:unnamed protein product [Rotaria sp. Silwood1]CAF0967798.1 unnamed protein product [Rotaria sp. Silwood1]